VAKALHRYGMISDGDAILVGLSGGLDSLTLLWILSDRLKRIPIDYRLQAVYVDPGFENGFSKALDAYCKGQGFDLRIEQTDFGPMAHSRINRENPCFLCAWNRRKRLFEIAEQLQCNKIALGHNKDDIIETLFLNICYSGEISTMVPAQDFFKGRFTLIRPLAFTDKETIRLFAKLADFPRFVNPCPSNQNSKRQEIRGLLNQLYRSNSKIKGNIFRSLQHVRTEYLL
jgi:tRNA 2-thiocytidine biosynthesis protein TtcA